MRDYVCPECRQPVEAGEPTVIAYSTSYRVHTECGDDTDRAGINMLQGEIQRLRVFEKSIREAMRYSTYAEIIAGTATALANLDGRTLPTLGQAAQREADR